MKTFFISSFLLLFIFSANLSFAQESKIDSLRQLMSGTDISFVPEKYKLLYAAGWSDEQIQQMKETLDIKSIYMERTGCFGTCPSYELTFHIDGTAEYNGRNHVDRRGKYTGKISLWSYGRLCYLIDKIGFEDFNENYRAPWTDSPSVTIVLTYKNETKKKVYVYSQYGPIEFWGLTKSIDGVAQGIEWEKK